MAEPAVNYSGAAVHATVVRAEVLTENQLGTVSKQSKFFGRPADTQFFRRHTINTPNRQSTTQHCYFASTKVHAKEGETYKYGGTNEMETTKSCTSMYTDQQIERASRTTRICAS